MQKFFKGKKVFITGHTGFKGSWLAYILASWGAQVAGFSLKPHTKPNFFELMGVQKMVHNYFADIRDFKKISGALKKEKPEIVVHLAAQALVRKSYDDPRANHETNIMGMANVLEAIRETHSVRSGVVITTDKVYKNHGMTKPYAEGDSLGGFDPYSGSKAAADIIASSYSQSFFNPDSYNKTHKTLIAIARAGNVIGGGDWGEDRLVPDIFRSVFEKNKIIEIRNPAAIRPWQHVLEPLAGYLALAKELYLGNRDMVGAWNFGPDRKRMLNVAEVASRAINFLKKGSYVIKLDKAKHEENILTLDASKAKIFLQWKPKLTFDQAFDWTFAWYKNFYENKKNIKALTVSQIKEYFRA